MQFFLDFDGTITENDIVDLILEHFASEEWKKVEKEWAEGKIGSRECLSRQIALVSATKEDILELISKTEADPHFVSFLKCAKKYGYPVTIVSDGFRIVIENILKRVLEENKDFMKSLSIYSNQLKWTDGLISACFPEGPVCEHGCANCKARVIESHRIVGEKIVFVGDGLSDRFAAKVSDLTFAKGKLLKFCEEKKIEHQKYSSFKDIEEWIEKHAAKPYLVEKN